MENLNHTEGPWGIYDIDSLIPHIGTVNPKIPWEYETICNFYEDVSDNYDTEYVPCPNYKNNAKLIVNDPEMYKLLKELYSDVQMGCINSSDYYLQLKELLSKIES